MIFSVSDSALLQNNLGLDEAQPEGNKRIAFTFQIDLANFPGSHSELIYRWDIGKVERTTSENAKIEFATEIVKSDD